MKWRKLIAWASRKSHRNKRVPRELETRTRGRVLREVFEELAKNKSLYQIHEETKYPLKTICKLAKKFKEDESWHRMFYPESGDPTTEHWNDYEKHPYQATIVPRGSGEAEKPEMPESFKRHQRVLERAWKERRTVKLITGKKRRMPLSFKTEQRLLKKAWEEGKPLGKIRKRERERVMKKKKGKHKKTMALRREQRLLKKAWAEKRTMQAVIDEEK